MNTADQFMLALTGWRENRGSGRVGMQSVMNVICNRAELRHTSPYQECIRPLQFSSISYHADPQLAKWPATNDPTWQDATALATQAASADGLTDITGGATNYYALSIPEPAWASVMTRTVEIEGQAFFK